MRSLPAPVLGLVLVIVVAGCAAIPAPTASPSTGSGPSTPGATDAIVDAAVCQIAQAPRPADGPPPARPDDPVDVRDDGPGRWRVCLADGGATVEGSAWCSWNDDRSTVTLIDGQAADLGRDQIRGSVSARDGVLSVLIDRNTETIVYQADGPAGPAFANGWQAGAFAFELDRRSDPTVPAGQRPDRLSGVLRWTCGDPPAPRPGRAIGQVDLRLDAPVDRDIHVTGSCEWATTPVGPRVLTITTSPLDIELNQRFVGIDMTLRDDRPEVAIWVDDHQQGASYTSYDEESAFLLAQSVDRSAGSARLRRLNMDGGSPVRLVPGAETLSGAISWSCQPPLAPGRVIPIVPGVREVAQPDPVRPTVPGSVRLSFNPAVADPIIGPVTCTLDRSDPAYLRVDRMLGVLDGAGRQIRFRSDGGSVLLVMFDASNGRPLGEYSGSVKRIADQADREPLLLDVPELEFEPVDAAYQPIGDSAGRTVGLLVDYSCDLSGLPPA